MHTIELFLFFKCYHFLENRVRQFRRRTNFAASPLQDLKNIFWKFHKDPIIIYGMYDFQVVSEKIDRW